MIPGFVILLVGSRVRGLHLVSSCIPVIVDLVAYIIYACAG